MIIIRMIIHDDNYAKPSDNKNAVIFLCTTLGLGYSLTWLALTLAFKKSL